MEQFAVGKAALSKLPTWNLPSDFQVVPGLRYTISGKGIAGHISTCGG